MLTTLLLTSFELYTDRPCFEIILGILTHIKCVLFPFPLLYFHSHPIPIISHMATSISIKFPLPCTPPYSFIRPRAACWQKAADPRTWKHSTSFSLSRADDNNTKAKAAND